MSVYKLPKTVLEGLSDALARFWWSNVEHKRRIHWISWDKMCLPKAMGGMGFRDFESFNQALLAKQAWRLLHCDESLVAQVLKGKYYETSSFMQAPLGKRPSYAWRSVLDGRALLSQGLKITVGNGSHLHVWSDPWLEDEDGLCRPPLRRQRFFDANLHVSAVIDFRSRRWSEQKLNELFVPRDIRILRRNQPVVSERDSWIWRHSRNGVYSVKTGYELAFARNKNELISLHNAKPSLNPLKAQIWQLKAPSKLKVFLWKAVSGALPVQDCLTTRGIKCDQVCQTCGLDGESINHVLFSCTFARQVWAVSGFPSPNGGFDTDSIYVNMSHLLVSSKHSVELQGTTRIFPWTLWYLWKNRNSLLFEGVMFDSEQVCAKAGEESSLWYAAQNLDSRSMDDHRDQSVHPESGWKRPPLNYVKCNIGCKWKKKKNIAGAAWVVRNSAGKVLLHSRRSFVDVQSVDEAQFLCVAWAIESMGSLRFSRVYFAFEGRMFVDAINRPKAWPSFKFKVLELRLLLRNFLDWKLLAEPVAANRGARLIASSAVLDCRFQSYVARGHPVWCQIVFDQDLRG